MKYYLIYKKDKFLGWADNKKIIKTFMKDRPGTYKIIKNDEEDIPEKIRKSFSFDNFQLTWFMGYYTSVKVALFNYEVSEFEEAMSRDSLKLHVAADQLIRHSKVIKFSKEEKKLINYVCSGIIDRVYGITDSNEIIYDECIDIVKYFTEAYLPTHRKFRFTEDRTMY